MMNRRLKNKLDAIEASDLAGKDKELAIKEALMNEKKTPLDNYFKKYYTRISFVVFYFLLLGGLSWFSLDAMFGQEKHVSAEAIGIINLILGGLMGKITEIFHLVKNGES